MALINAREQAEPTATGLGMKVDGVFAISPVAFPEIESTIFRSSPDQGTTDRVVVTGMPEYVLGPMSVSHSVHVIYLISPAK